MTDKEIILVVLGKEERDKLNLKKQISYKDTVIELLENIIGCIFKVDCLDRKEIAKEFYPKLMHNVLELDEME